MINSDHVSESFYQSEFFLGLDTCNANEMNFRFPVETHTSDDQRIASIVRFNPLLKMGQPILRLCFVQILFTVDPYRSAFERHDHLT